MLLPARACMAPDWSAEPLLPPHATCRASQAMSRCSRPLTAYPTRRVLEGWVVAGPGRGLSHVIGVHEPNLGPPGPWTRAERP